MPEPVNPASFTSSDQFFEASHSALEAYEKEEVPEKKDELLTLVKSHTAKGKELLVKEKETRGKFAIPEAHKAKPWASKIKTEDDLYAQIENLSAAVGKKEVPFDYAAAKPEEIEAHLAAHRPKEAKEYKIGTEEEEKADPEFLNAVKGMFHKSGLDQYQAENLYKEYTEIENARREKAFNSEEYNRLAKEAFGENFKAEAGKSSNLLINTVSPEDKEFFDKAFPNQHAIFVHKMLNKIMQQYGINESDKGGGINRGGGGNNLDAIEKQLTEKRNQILNLSRQMHTEEQKRSLVSELQALTEKKHQLMNPKK